MMNVNVIRATDSFKIQDTIPRPSHTHTHTHTDEFPPFSLFPGSVSLDEVNADFVLQVEKKRRRVTSNRQLPHIEAMIRRRTYTHSHSHRAHRRRDRTESGVRRNEENVEATCRLQSPLSLSFLPSPGAALFLFQPNSLCYPVLPSVCYSSSAFSCFHCYAICQNTRFSSLTSLN
jgi:hypothetical protein